MSSDSHKLTFSEQRTVYSVSALNHEARDVIETQIGTVWVEGEVSNLAKPASGHRYWSLKDEHAQVRCAMFRQYSRQSGAALENGQQVLVRGRVSVYVPRGDFQLIVDYVEEAGVGALRRRFEQLKEKLAAEGLFDEARKRPLPPLPNRIGVITSPSGAAIHDVLTALRRRFAAIPVLIYPSSVQGADAPGELAQALDTANRRRECDLLILTRGGGSIEDLWAFNEEILARAIARSEIPVICGVGHETDFTIADFVADLRAPTPSQAAELAAPPRSDFEQRLAQVRRSLAQFITARHRAEAHGLAALEHRLERAHPGAAVREYAQRVDDAERRLRDILVAALGSRQRRLQRLELRLTACHPRTRIEQMRSRCARIADRSTTAIKQRLERAGHRLRLAERTLQSLSPLATLDRGYAIVMAPSGKILRRSADTRTGEVLGIRLAQGSVSAAVTTVEPEEKAVGSGEKLRD
jgi:exodeoxyribonuclease VII large subunit